MITIKIEEAIMDHETKALMIQEGGKLISVLLMNRPLKTHERIDQQEVIKGEQDLETPEVKTGAKQGKASSIEAGCVPCAIGHLGTCSGVINEAVRFAKKDGIESSEVIDRVNMCLDELNAMERVDLRPEMIVQLPEWENALANQALVASRSVRHELEGLTSAGGLEQAAANIQKTRTGIGRSWFQQRLSRMPKEEKAKLAEKAIQKLEE